MQCSDEPPVYVCYTWSPGSDLAMSDRRDCVDILLEFKAGEIVTRDAME
jgi:hypothetical protein